MRGPADASADAEGWIETPRGDGRRSVRLAELWAYRELVAFLALRDLRARYKQAAFGFGWAVVQPLSGAIVLTVVFRELAGVPSDGIPYLVFAFLGFSVWSYFSSSLNAANISLVANSALVTKVYFPRLAAPFAAVLPGTVDLGIALGLTGVLMVVQGVSPGLALLTLPLWVAAVVLVALGVGLLLATATVQYRDVPHAFGLLTQLLLFASPVAYPASLVPERWLWLYHVNPMAGVISGFRWSMLGGTAPGAPALVSLATGVALLWLGLRYFGNHERRFADVI
jgi:ABC-type polysaccharide/polyol phosphate export permease